MGENNKNDFFAELAKVKSKPMSLKVESEEDDLKTENENEAEGTLVVDVFRDEDNIIVQAAVAGVNEENLDISITNESISIKGERARAQKVEEKDYYYQECFWGSFSRTIILPEEVDPDSSTASVKNGVLTVKMPRLNRKKVKKLKIKTS